jgi:tRNA G18 (ribose-2'-O)-methylase SpoU
LKEAIKANASIQEVLMTEAFHQQSDLKIAEGDIIIVSPEILASLAQTETPQGVVAIVQIPEDGSDFGLQRANISFWIRCRILGMSAPSSEQRMLPVILVSF